MADTSAGAWHPDPTGRHEHRWWDGTQWTDQVADGSVTGTDPLNAPPVAPATDWGSGTPPFAAAYPATGAPAPTPRKNRTLLVILGAIAVVLVVVVIVLVSGNSDNSDQRAQLVAGCAQDGTFSRSTCECVVDHLVDQGHSIDEIVDLDMDLQGNRDIDPALLDDAIDAFATCG